MTGRRSGALMVAEDDGMITASVDVPFGDPHNDQLFAHAQDDLAQHVAGTRKTLLEGDGRRVETMVTVAVALRDAMDAMPRGRLAALLATAMLLLAENTPTALADVAEVEGG
jgi:hypothetical protein